jgi:hypothetical protein
MFDIIILNLISPTIIKRMNFASYFTAHLNVECLIYFRKASLSKYWQNEISLIKHCECFNSADTAVFALLFVSNPLVFKQILTFFLVKHVQLFSDASLLIFHQFLLKLINFFLLIFVYIIEFWLF